VNATIRINGKSIGAGYPTYVVAEMSANHGQDFEEAAALVRIAREVGADAIKLQTYTPDTITIRSERPEFRIGGGTLWDGRTLHDLYGEAFMPWDWQPRLKEVADEVGLDFFSAAFDPTAVSFLEDIGTAAHKVASFEIVDLPLISRMAATGKPLIISTGMSTLAEIDEAVRTARAAGAREIALLKCTSAYPTPPEEANLRTIPHLATAFGVPAGLSDHTMGIAVPVAAVALGACIVEKHFTRSRSIPGPDAAFSLEPDEFRAMVDGIRVAERALGEVRYDITEPEMKSRGFRRSLYVVRDIAEGEEFTADNVRSIRPANGLHPRHAAEIQGRRAARAIAAGTPLDWELVR
jgi:N-acetylneuraminate synthase